MNPNYGDTELPWIIDEKAFPENGSMESKLSYLLRYAILAPSVRNTQPWRFHVRGNQVSFLADLSRWLKVADRDQRELRISTGCALENFLIAARHFNVRYKTEYFPEPAKSNLVARVTLLGQHEEGRAAGERLFSAVLNRQTNHMGFLPEKDVPAEIQEQLLACNSGEGASLLLIKDEAAKHRLDQLSVKGDAIQFATPGFLEELREDLTHEGGAGPWLIAKLHRMAVGYLSCCHNIAPASEEMLVSAPIVGLIVSQEDNALSQLLTGQLFERVWLAATSNGLSLQPMTQALQLPELRAEMANSLHLAGQQPQQLFRLGYARHSDAEYTPRRPLHELLEEG